MTAKQEKRVLVRKIKRALRLYDARKPGDLIHLRLVWDLVRGLR